MAQAISPSFSPGSGWYRPGSYAPGSDSDRAGMKGAAIQCSVVVLRRRGDRIPAAQLLAAEPPIGWLVCQDRYTAPAWYACLFAVDMRQELLPRLLRARLQRENEGVRLYAGIQVDADTRQQWPQSWLCTPTPARAREILLGVLEHEGGA